MAEEPTNARPPVTAFRGFLAWVVGLGTCLVIGMATLAFGPSGFGFGVVIAATVFGLMVKRYRFSLRTFFLFTTVLGVWLGLKISRDLKLQRAITSITNAGGHLTIPGRVPGIPWRIWSDRYDLSFYNLNKPLIREQLAALDAFGPSSLRNLDLSNTGITDNDLKFVSSKTSVVTLSLANVTYWDGKAIPDRPQNQITDTGVKRINELRKLVGIDLSGTGVTDNCVRGLSEMQNLIWINLNGTHVTGAGMAQFSDCKELGMLELNGCPISAEGVKELSKLTNLHSLGLRNSGITDADVDLLNTLPQIGILRLDKIQVSDQAVKRFSDSHPKCKIDR